MIKKSEEIEARHKKYSATQTAADSLGRLISVRRLKPSQQLTIEGLASDLMGSMVIIDPSTGREIEVPRNMPLKLAATVVEIDGNPVTFPKTRPELNALLDRLDDEGMGAVAEALSKFGVPDSVEDVEAQTKN